MKVILFVCVKRNCFSISSFWSKESIVLLRSNLREGAQLESEGEGVRGKRAGPLLFSTNLRNFVQKFRNAVEKFKNTDEKFRNTFEKF